MIKKGGDEIGVVVLCGGRVAGKGEAAGGAGGLGGFARTELGMRIRSGYFSAATAGPASAASAERTGPSRRGARAKAMGVADASSQYA